METSRLKTERPQCVIIFGAPLSGTSSAIKCLHDASTTPTVIWHGTDCEDDPSDFDVIRNHIANGLTVFVDDFDPTTENVQKLHDSRIAAPGYGTLVRMWSDDDKILARALVSGREDVDAEYLREFRENLLLVEDRIRVLAMPYRTIPNGMMFEMTVKHLAEIAGITR